MKSYTINFIKVSEKNQNNMRNDVLNNISFNKISEEKLDKISEKYKINKNIILSYRNQLIKEYIIFNYYKINSKIEYIIKEYENNNILDISKKLKYSPMSIMRLIIKKKYPLFKLSKKTINKLEQKDQEQLNIANNNDNFAKLNQDIQQQKSEEYESKIAEFLNKTNIKYKIQEDLIKEQTNSKGYAYATPDFLLEEKHDDEKEKNRNSNFTTTKHTKHKATTHNKKRE